MTFLSELKRRKVYQVAAIYAGAAWGFLQIADIIFPRLGLPDWSITFLFALEVVGFPLALILSWIFDYAPGQLVVTSEESRSKVAACSGSVAVLPFNNMSDDPSLTHFADGLVEDLITRLQEHKAIAVNSRNSTFAYRGTAVDVVKVARELGADFVIEGSVRLQGATARVTAQLIDAPKDHHLWAQKWDRPLLDIFALQDELVETISNAVLPFFPAQLGAGGEAQHKSGQERNETPSPVPGEPAGLPKRAIALAIVLLLGLSSALTWTLEQRRQERQAREEVLPQIEALIAADQKALAYQKITEIAELLPSDPLLLRYQDQVSALSTIRTEPSGVRVLYQPYEEEGEDWRELGVTPLEGVRLPKGYLRFKFEGDTVTTTQRLFKNPSLLLQSLQLRESSAPAPTVSPIQLARASEGREGMVYVPALAGGITLPAGVPPLDLTIPGFFLDRYEVTNAQFQEFVDAGGYSDQRYWKHLDMAPLLWPASVAAFTDQTGQPGPAGWELGHFPHARGEYPVTGVSWFEASAYARFRNKELPTIYHWYGAALERDEIIVPLAPAIISQSNFSAEGLAAVGSYRGIGFFGAYDLGGNAREWLQNADQELRWIAGGAWNQTPYMLTQGDVASPTDRGATNGFRCMVNADARPTAESLRITTNVRDTQETDIPTPVSDDVYAIFREQFAYLKQPLEPRTISTRELAYWNEELIRINSPYSKEGMDLLLLLPRDASGPLQTMVFMPGSDAFADGVSMAGYDWGDYEVSVRTILNSGRALVIPVWDASFGRGGVRRTSLATLSEEALATLTRTRVAHWRQDLGSALDYLESREDIDSTKIGFLGLSYGASYPLALLAVEARLKTAVLVAGGISQWGAHPMVDPYNHMPRVTLPVLMLNGRYDYDMPLNSTQIPLFELLGSPAGKKKHVVYEAGHVGYPVSQQRREIMRWLDIHLGKVR